MGGSTGHDSNLSLLSSAPLSVLLLVSYHNLPTKHLDAYLDELEWRSSNRDNPYLFRDTLLKLIRSENLPYQE